jgi:WD40 repeat protein
MPVRLCTDGRQAVVGGGDGTVRYWDVETGSPTREVRHTGWSIDDLCVGDDGGLVTVRGGAVEVWTPAGDRPVQRLSGGSRSGLASQIRSVSLSADGRFALAGDDDGLRLWDTATGEIVRTFERPPPEGFHSIRMTTDARFAVCAAYWSFMTVWDVRSGRCLRVLDGYEKGVSCLALTPDGRFLLTGGVNGLRRWELDWELEAPDAADPDDGAGR